jgi:hypothetical protein
LEELKVYSGYTNCCTTSNADDKKTGVEKRLKNEITLKNDYDLGIVSFLTSQGFDVETERVQTTPYSGELRIKVYEVVNHHPKPLDNKNSI